MRLALGAEAGGLEPVVGRRAEAVVELRRLHVARSETGVTPQAPGQRRAAGHVVVEDVADVAGPRRRRVLGAGGDVGRWLLEVAGALSAGQHEGGAAFDRDVAV